MELFFDPSLPLGRRSPYLDSEQALASRIRTVLETRPGRIPWRPTFGCDLSGLVGQPATVQRLNEARWRVEEALRRWIPEANVIRCQVRVVNYTDPGTLRGYHHVPLAESALLSLGIEAGLEVLIDVETPAGAIAVQAMVEP